MGLRDHLLTLREPIRSVARANGAYEIHLFGSVARGQEVDGSDVDFLVKLEVGRTLLDLARLQMKLEALIGRPVDVVTESSLQEPIRAAALRESIRV